jgi:hypothetical protein
MGQGRDTKSNPEGVTPPTDTSQWFEYGQPPDRFLNYGGKGARLRVIPVVRKKFQSNPNGVYVNPTSSGKDGEDHFSPLYLGPCRLYGPHTAKKMESAWQHSKVYLDVNTVRTEGLKHAFGDVFGCEMN